MEKEESILIIVLIQVLLFGLTLNAQSIVNFGKFPVLLNSDDPIEVSELLDELDWEFIKEYAKENEGHYAYERKDSLRIEYEYVQQGRVASFKIVSFNGKVLEFYSEITNTSKPSRISYFDKNIWLLYVGYKMPDFEERFKISIDEPQRTLKAYYTLLGVDSRDEYGWICEYSTIGMATKRRQAVIDLRGETEMLINLLDYSNIQTQLYAADALIYSDFIDRKMIEESKDPSFKKYLRSQLLSKSIWRKIDEIRDSNKEVLICGNSGSYKIYASSTMELLSDQAKKEIPGNYESLKENGYFR